jgi:cobalt-zinc-cadmium efflux system outer membrane protein
LQSVNYQKEDTTRSVILNFLSVYFQTLSDKSYYEYLKQDLDDYEKMLQIQEKKQKAGFLSLIDYMKLQLYKNELENSKLQAESTYKKDLQEIKFYLNGNYDPVSVNIDTKEPNLDDLIQKATEKRESIKALQEQLNSVEHQIKLIKAYSIPDVSLGVEYDSFGTQYKPGIGFGFSLNLPTFDKRKGDLITAIALKEQTLVVLSKEKDRIRKEISQAYEDYQVSKKIYNSYLEKKKVMDDLLERTKKAYSLGGISTLDFLDTLRTYKFFMNAYLQSYYQFLNNYSSLKILSGEDL